MPTNQYGQTEWDADPETAAELRRLSNQEKIAAEMMKRGQVPLDGRMVGQTYVGASPLQGLANMFHQYNAGQATLNAEEGYKALGDSNRIRRDNETQKIVEAISGRPTQPMGPPTEAGEMGVNPAVPAGSREQVMKALASSTIPAYRDAGLKGMILDKTATQEPYTLPAGASRYGANGNLIVTAPKVAKGEDKPDQVQQYEFAQTPAGGNYKGTFSQFKTLGPALTAAAIAPLRAAQVENIGSENAYNLPPARPAPKPPKVGQVVDGYKFKGGDPANQSNWEKK